MKLARTFRVFVSSTFSDLKAEREALQKRVFPKLRQLCEKGGGRFQAIDLRWGVSDEAALDQQTMNICLEELHRCQEATPRPNFIVLLGDRYGWCPPPPQIPAAEFDAILREISNESDRALLAEWYRRDHNAVPAQFLLQPRAGKASEPSHWFQLERRLHRTLAAGATRIRLSAAARLKYEASATHQEVDAGALHSEHPTRQVFCFFRDTRAMPRGRSASLFRDLGEGGQVDREAERRLRHLKSELVRKLPDKIHRYVARWTGRRPSTKHIPKLCADVYQCLSRVIRSEMSRLSKVDSLTQEIAAHDAFGAERAHSFTGRVRLLNRIQRYLHGADQCPMALHGVSGSGKSALIARAYADWKSRAQRHAVVVRFIGATAGSSDIRALLESLCREIARKYARPEEVDPDYKLLIAAFAQRLAFATDEKPLTLFLDALDQLSDADRARNLMWLPSELPPHVHIVVSTLPGECSTILRKRVRLKNHLEVVPMAASEGETLLGLWLSEAGRTLQPPQRAQVLRSFRKTCLPLHLKLAFEEARRWHSYTPLSQTRLAANVPGVIGQLFDRLSLDATHGRTLVSRSLRYLAASKSGLTEDELLDILSRDRTVLRDFALRSPRSPFVSHLPFIVWSRLYADIEAYLAQRRGDGASLISFYHRQLAEAAAARFLAGRELRVTHVAMARYFFDAASRLRRLSELPYQQTAGEQWRALQQTLTDLDFIEAKCQASRAYDLVADYNAAAAAAALPPAARRRINVFARFVKAQAYLLCRRPALTFQQAANEPDSSGPARVAHGEKKRSHAKRPWLRWVNKPQTQPRCLMVLVGHIGEINACDVSPDGKRLVSAGLDRAVRLWDPATGLEVMTLIGHTSPIASCAYSPDGSCAASADYRGCIKLWDPQTGAELASFKAHPNQIELCAFSRDGKRLISAGNDNTLRIWDVPTRRQITILSKHSITAMACAFSPDGQRIATGDQSGELTLWSGKTYNKIARIRAHDAEIKSCTFSPNGRWLLTSSEDKTFKRWSSDLRGEPLVFAGHSADVWVSCVSPDHRWIASGSGDDTIKLWEAKTGIEVGELTGHTEAVLSCAFLAGGDRLVTSSWDGTIRVWDLAWLKHLRPARIARARPQQADSPDKRYWLSCAISPDGSFFLAGSEDEIHLWNAATGALLQRFGKHADYVRHCAFSPDAGRLFSAAEATLYVWDRHQPAQPQRHQIHRNLISGFHLTPDGKGILSSSEDGTLLMSESETGKRLAVLLRLRVALTASAAAPDWSYVAVGDVTGRLRIISLPGGKVLANFPAHADELATASFSPDGRLLVTGGMDSLVKVWEVATWKLVATIAGHTAPVLFCAFSPDGRSLASSARDATLKTWDLISFRPRQTLVGHITEFWTFAWTPDGKRILSSSYDGTLRLWNPSTGSQLAMLSGFRDSVVAGRLSPDASRFVSASHFRALRIYNGASGARLGQLEGHEAEVRDCAFSPDSRSIVSASADGTLRIWDATTAEPLQVLRGHTGPVQSCAFAPDGKRLVSGSWDKTLKIWDAPTGQAIATLAGHADWVQHVAFSPDGKRIASFSLDCTIRLWDAATAALVATLSGHRDAVEFCVFSLDGRRLLSGSGDGTLKVWDGSVALELFHLDAYCGPIRCGAIAPQGGLAAFGAMDRTVRLWNFRRGTTRVLGEHESWVLCCAFSPDGRWLLTGGNDKFIKLWNVRERRLDCEYWVGAAVRCLAWRPAGGAFIVGDEEGRVLILSREGHG